jgi:hypothetical protein
MNRRLHRLALFCASFLVAMAAVGLVFWRFGLRLALAGRAGGRLSASGNRPLRAGAWLPRTLTDHRMPGPYTAGRQTGAGPTGRHGRDRAGVRGRQRSALRQERNSYARQPGPRAQPCRVWRASGRAERVLAVWLQRRPQLGCALLRAGSVFINQVARNTNSHLGE